MFNCGMDDGAGHWACNWACNWACKVGLPAKSGVGGGIMAVVNRRMGIGVFSPRLDPAGNSVRGHATCMRLVEELGLHAFDSTQFGSTLLGAFG
jgi:glutaminase